MHTNRLLSLLASGAILLAACARADAGAADTTAASAGASAPPSPAVASDSLPGPTGEAALRLVTAPQGNEARYLVREQLLGRDLPNDAVGRTGAVTGSLALDATGAVIPAASRFEVSVAELASDSDRRDGYVRRRLLETEQHPTVTLRPTALRGLPSPLPAASASSGTHEVQLVGDLTVRGVTRPTTWRVTARHENGRVTGTARTAFTFEEFGLEKPRVRSVLSVADTIRLEYDFSLVPAGDAAR